MKLTQLKAHRYKSLEDVRYDIGPVNVLLGMNSSGKSNILGALGLLAEAIRANDFAQAVEERGGFSGLAWWGAEPSEVVIETHYEDAGTLYAWRVTLKCTGHEFEVWEQLDESRHGGAPSRILDARGGKAWWTSAQTARNQGFRVSLSSMACALAMACTDESFPGWRVGRFVQRWGLFAPVPALIRGHPGEMARIDPTGRELAGRLSTLGATSEGARMLERIDSAARRALGLPASARLHVSERDDQVNFTHDERDLTLGARTWETSNSTLRVLALMTALFGEPGERVIMIDEPDLHLHPRIMSAFAGSVREASARLQILISTHAPALVDGLGRPEEVCFVRAVPSGTQIERLEDPDAVRRGMASLELGLGTYLWVTKKFGA